MFENVLINYMIEMISYDVIFEDELVIYGNENSIWDYWVDYTRLVLKDELVLITEIMEKSIP